jgi:hypothetical protein
MVDLDDEWLGSMFIDILILCITMIGFASSQEQCLPSISRSKVHMPEAFFAFRFSLNVGCSYQLMQQCMQQRSIESWM